MFASFGCKISKTAAHSSIALLSQINYFLLMRHLIAFREQKKRLISLHYSKSSNPRATRQEHCLERQSDVSKQTGSSTSLREGQTAKTKAEADKL
jgi:hypothetical protein